MTGWEGRKRMIQRKLQRGKKSICKTSAGRPVAYSVNPATFHGLKDLTVSSKTIRLCMTNNDPCDERWKAVALVYRQAAWVSARVRPRYVAKNRPTTTRYYDRVIDMIFFQIVLRLSTHMCKFIWPSSRENETILTILCKGQHLWRSGHYWYISQRLLCARTVHPSTHSDISSLTVFDGRPFVVCLIYIYTPLFK